MSTISNIATSGTHAAGLLAAMGAAVKRWWDAYVAWRVEEAAVAQLKGMSDRELKDIGLVRSQIEIAVRGRVDHERDRVLSRIV